MGKGAAYAESDPATALEALERVQALAEQCGNRVHESLAVAEVAALRARAADPIAALRGLQQMLEATRGATDAMFARHGLANLIPLFERLGQPEAAVTLYGRLTRVFQSHALIPDLPDTILRTRRAVGAATFEAAASRGTDTTAE